MTQTHSPFLIIHEYFVGGIYKYLLVLWTPKHIFIMNEKGRHIRHSCYFVVCVVTLSLARHSQTGGLPACCPALVTLWLHWLQSSHHGFTAVFSNCDTNVLTLTLFGECASVGFSYEYNSWKNLKTARVISDDISDVRFYSWRPLVSVFVNLRQKVFILVNLFAQSLSFCPYRITNVWPARTMPPVSSDACECLQLQRVCGHKAGGRTF